MIIRHLRWQRHQPWSKEILHHAARIHLPAHRPARPSSLTNLPRPRHANPHRGLSISSILLPPTVFLGLLLTLWTYKCVMMILFQDKIIYMPSVPPFSRSEKLADYTGACKPIHWRQEFIRSMDGTRIALAIGENQARRDRSVEKSPDGGGGGGGGGGLVVVYFQGNGASLPPRLPGLSDVLRGLDKCERPVPCTLVAVSYRGYWTSTGRASQRGIERDAAAALEWVEELQEQMGDRTQVVLWGQSIGCGVATTAMANLLVKQEQDEFKGAKHTIQKVAGIVLETPFTSISNMLVAFYPQKWLPYRYLTPFLWNHWDSVKALRMIKQRQATNLRLLVMIAKKDEVVPPEEGQELRRLCDELGFDVTYQAVPGALHTECLIKGKGRQGIVEFLNRVQNDGEHV